MHAPAALGADAALATALPGRISRSGQPAVVDLVVAEDRRVIDPGGVRTTRITDYDAVVLSHLGPPRVRIEHAALTVASRETRLDAVVAVLGDVCQSRATTPHRLLDHLASRTRLPHRRLIGEVLGDVALGANSALERRYLRDVERSHGLPRGHRQPRARLGTASAYRDVDYRQFRTIVELDGRLGHDGTADRWDDLDRDVLAAVGGSLTVRIGWRQVLEPCRLADAVAAIVAARGWADRIRACPRGCRPAC